MVTRVCAKAVGTARNNARTAVAMRGNVTFFSSMHGVVLMG
jgi:hypothetical protein